MKDYPSNSHKSKEEKAMEEANDQKEKKVQKVVSGKVRTKANEKRKLMNLFVSEDVGNVKTYVMFDVLVPALRKLVYDIIVDGTGMLLGEGGRREKRNRSDSRTPYRSYYDEPRGRSSRDGRSRDIFDYEDIFFDSRPDAEEVLNRMLDILDEYNMVTVANMFELSGECAPHTAYKYGWMNLRTANVVRTRNGYEIRLPKAMPIE